MRSIALIVCLLAGAACDGRSLTATDASSGRVPLNHRAQGTSCPSARGPGSTANACMLPGEPAGCTSDSSCTEGTNGRCNSSQGGPIVDCVPSCSYDLCASDSDCPDDTPCLCRDSATSGAANRCYGGGNCRVDSDCGPGGFCSPSLVNQACACLGVPCPPDAGAVCAVNGVQVPCDCDPCGHGYFCHTKQDTCVDDSDCPSGAACDYDAFNAKWACSTCEPVP